jgi:hypothetical protein
VLASRYRRCKPNTLSASPKAKGQDFITRRCDCLLTNLAGQEPLGFTLATCFCPGWLLMCRVRPSVVLREPTGARSGKQKGAHSRRAPTGRSFDDDERAIDFIYRHQLASTAFFAELDDLLSAGNCRTGAVMRSAAFAGGDTPCWAACYVRATRSRMSATISGRESLR